MITKDNRYPAPAPPPTCMYSLVCIESVESVEGHRTLIVLTHEGLLLGVDPHVDLQGVGGEKCLAAVVTFVLVLVLVDPNIASFAWSFY